MSGPKYRQTVDVIKELIASGEVSGEITLGRIRELTGATDSTSRRTASELVDEGILENHPGLPYRIVSTPEEAAKQADTRPAKVQLAEVRKQIAELRSDVPAGLADKLEWIVAALEDVYERQGWDLPEDGTSERGKQPAPAARHAAAN